MEKISFIKNRYIDYIDNIILNKRVSHAYVLEVDNYESDIDYLLLFIKMILCNMTSDEIKKSDNNIISLVDTGNYPDLYYISSDTSVIKKKMMLDLQKEFSNKSLYNNKKIYVIKEAEKLNDSSANTILKFLEEPEDDIIAFLITNNRYHLIETILSRCQILSLKEDFNDLDIDDNLYDLLDLILNPNLFFINYNSLRDLFLDKNSFINLLIKIENVLLSYLSKKNTKKNLMIILKKNSDNYYVDIISIIEDEIIKLSYNVNFKLWLDSFFLRLLGGKNIC